MVIKAIDKEIVEVTKEEGARIIEARNSGKPSGSDETGRATGW